MMNVKTAVLLVGCLPLIACVGKNPQPASHRTPSSEAEPVVWRDPSTQKSFWDEFEAAQNGQDDTDQSSSEFKIGVFFKWMRANPRAVVEDLRRQGVVIPVTVGNQKRFSKAALEKVYLVVGTDEILNLKTGGEDFSLWRHEGSRELTQGTLALTQADFGKGEWANSMRELLDRESYVGRNFEGRLYGRVEFVNQLARKFSQRLNEKALGVTGLTSKQWTDASRAIVEETYFNPLSNSKVSAAAHESRLLIRDLIRAHLDGKLKATPGSYLARVESALKALPEASKAQAIDQLVNELVAAEISQTLASHALDQIFAHGQVNAARNALLGNRQQEFQNIVREALRFQPMSTYRVATALRDVSIGAERIPKGSKVIAVNAAIGFDSQVFSDPNTFKADRWSQDLSRFANLPAPFSNSDGSTSRQTAFDEAVVVLAEILRQPGLRRVEGHFGQLDHRTTFVPGKLKDIYRFSVPEQLSVEYDAPATRARFEIPDKNYPYEEYLQDYDRVAFRQCLGGLSKIRQMDETPAENSFTAFLRNMREVGAILRQTPAIMRSFGVTRKNRNQENKHLFYCRMPAKFRTCFEPSKIDIQTDFGPKHVQAFESCQNHLKHNEAIFYRSVFFGEDVNYQQVTFEQSKGPRDPAYDFEDQIKFYSRYRARESMMNPAGFTMAVPKMLFYVRLNIDFRMCIGGPVLKHKFTLGRDGTSKEEQYEICKDGVFNPQTFKKEGGLTLVEKFYYESVMLDRAVEYADIVRKETAK